MTFRVTKKDLDLALDRLNSISKREYRFNWAYGKVQLVVKEHGSSINRVGFLDSKPEMYYTLHTLLNYLEKERRDPV